LGGVLKLDPPITMHILKNAASSGASEVLRSERIAEWCPP
jgi:hypothetical protein